MDTESNGLPDAKSLFEQMCIDGTRFQAHKFVSAVESYEGLKEAVDQGSEIKSNYLPLLFRTSRPPASLLGPLPVPS
jgi:hypothetical protein